MTCLASDLDARPFSQGAELAPGYTAIECLSRGDSIDVYDAWSTERECRCIVKLVRPERRDDSRSRRMLLREGHLLRRLCHPHFVRCYEVLRSPQPTIVLETLTGATLSHVIRTAPPLPVEDLAVLGTQLCSALGYLHRRTGVLHLDLKPSNIIAEDGRAKLIDLGIARRPGRGHRGVGTDQYLAPEQARGDRVTAATDVWGLGATLFEAATQQCPFDSRYERDYEQLRRRAAPLQSHRDLPRSFCDAIDRCLEPDPAQRPTLAELGAVFQALLG